MLRETPTRRYKRQIPRPVSRLLYAAPGDRQRPEAVVLKIIPHTSPAETTPSWAVCIEFDAARPANKIRKIAS
jgi:hypothetical protein